MNTPSFVPDPEEIEQIRKLYEIDKKTMAEIGAIFGVGYKPIRRIFEEYKIGRFAKPQYIIRHKYADATFTAEGDAIIKRMIAEEKSIAEIREVLGGVDSKVISRRIKELGLEPTGLRIDPTEEQLQTIREMHAAKATQRQIAAAVGLDRIVIRRLFKELELTPNTNGKIRRVPEVADKILVLNKGGLMAYEIAEQLDLSPSSVQLFLGLQGINISRALTDDEKVRILELRKDGNGTRAIAKLIDRDRNAVQDYLHDIGLKNVQPPPKPPQPEPTHKTCKVCNETKPIDDFKKCWKVLDNGERTYSRHSQCSVCHGLRKSVSGAINMRLKRVAEGKNGVSCLPYLPYTILELKQYLEAIFREPGNEWMAWDNWGVYRSDLWNDNDPATWTWQIDHIVPHASFRYTTMDSPEFKECWALSNLRPYSSKQNIIDNDRNIRLLDDDEAEDDWETT